MKKYESGSFNRPRLSMGMVSVGIRGRLNLIMETNNIENLYVLYWDDTKTYHIWIQNIPGRNIIHQFLHLSFLLAIQIPTYDIKDPTAG